MAFEVTDNQTGKVIIFEEKPSEQDLEEAFALEPSPNIVKGKLSGDIGYEYEKPSVPPGIEPPLETGEPRPAKSIIGRGEAAAVGGMVGAKIGAPVLPPYGMLAGGALGAAAGSLSLDSFTSLKAMLEGRSEDIPTATEQVGAAAREGYLDLAFGMAGAAFQPIKFARALLSKISGLATPIAKEIQAKAAKFGIGVGAVDVGGTLPQAYAKTIGVFPWSGTPFRKAEIAKRKQISGAIENILDTFGPNKIMSDLGIDMVAAARGAHRSFRSTSAVLYKNVENAIEQAARQDIIPTDIVREVASGFAEQAKKGTIKIPIGKKQIATHLVDSKGQPILKTIINFKELPRASQETVIKFIDNLRSLPETITPTQYRQLKGDLSDLIGKNLRDGWDVKQLTEIKGALETGFNNLRTDLLPAGQGEAIKDFLTTANKFYSKGIVQFQTKVAKTFERVDKTIFKVGAETPGSLNADEIYQVAVNLKSPKQIGELTKLVGNKNMKAAASLHFETAVGSSTKQTSLLGEQYNTIDPFELEKSLGLVGASKQKLAGVNELYKIGGVNLKDITDLIDVMKRIEEIRNPSEFIRRRLILAGMSGAAAVGGAGFIAGGGPVTIGAMTLLSRHFSKIFADPKKLKLMTTAMDEAKNAIFRQSSLGRLTKMLVVEEKQESKPLVGTYKKGTIELEPKSEPELYLEER